MSHHSTVLLFHVSPPLLLDRLDSTLVSMRSRMGTTEEWRRMMMDGLTTCCPFSGVSGSSVMEVTPRQSIAYVALTGNCHWCHLHCGVSTTCLST
ncbi:hypothetical protein HanXRQr2_Chr10g0435351 [Helianthus annuus]|uniref:Uncharacterized protein n=2 Tax=Helianthus annuus TaxID=4232 RepID=A0A9K3N422_HELAN|nr:hypothetical protein HanXRQr2_Chr10g0435351 [Helianthus annuus]